MSEAASAKIEFFVEQDNAGRNIVALKYGPEGRTIQGLNYSTQDQMAPNKRIMQLGTIAFRKAMFDFAMKGKQPELLNLIAAYRQLVNTYGSDYEKESYNEMADEVKDASVEDQVDAHLLYVLTLSKDALSPQGYFSSVLGSTIVDDIGWEITYYFYNGKCFSGPGYFEARHVFAEHIDDPDAVGHQTNTTYRFFITKFNQLTWDVINKFIKEAKR